MNTKRRIFVKGVIATSLINSIPISLNANVKINHRKSTQELTGKKFYLSIDKTIVNITGNTAVATTVNNMLSGPTLRWKEGEEVTLYVTNNLEEDTSIHWHGIILPPNMDGVPGISFNGIKPGETFIYKFPVVQSGTYWYHSHSGFQEQTGIYGAIVIEPIEKDPYSYDKEYVISLSDWSDEKPSKIYRNLKLQADYYNFQQRTINDFWNEVKEKGFFNAFTERKMWNEMKMNDRDISDVTGYTYTYLMNGENPASVYKALFSNGDKVRLRFINSSAMTFFDVRIPGLKMKVVAADGNNIQAIDVDEFRIGVAETYDVIVEPDYDKSYSIFAQSIDRSGFAFGALTYDKDVLPETPDVDSIKSLTHTDMGMNMSKMVHSSDSNMNNMKDTNHKMMDHSKHMMSDMKDMKSNKKKNEIPITKLAKSTGVQTDMISSSPQYRLSDPGVGLRNNGRRVLTYADLRSLKSTKHDKSPDREIILRLTGNMERYMWSINGIAYKDAKPLKFKFGERLRITYINDTMMNHPMHLHGMWSDLETGDENYLPKKHTVVVQPGAKISFRVTVDAKGEWAYHCHLLYHMTDMFRKVIVE